MASSCGSPVPIRAKVKRFPAVSFEPSCGASYSTMGPQERKSTYEKYVLVKRRAAHPATANEENGERIPKEEAICRKCFEEFKEDNALKIKCACPTTLIHENCESVWLREGGNNKCDVCGQEMEKTPAALMPLMIKCSKGLKEK